MCVCVCGSLVKVGSLEKCASNVVHVYIICTVSYSEREGEREREREREW